MLENLHNNTNSTKRLTALSVFGAALLVLTLATACGDVGGASDKSAEDARASQDNGGLVVGGNRSDTTGENTNVTPDATGGRITAPDTMGQEDSVKSVQ